MNNKSSVAIIGCESYDEDAVLTAVRKGCDLIGGMGAFIKTGEKIVLKPNVLYGAEPARAVTTHPAVLRAVAILCKETGASVTYGDSFMVGSSARNLAKSGLAAVMTALEVPVADFDHGERVSHPGAKIAKEFIISKAVLEHDGLISVSKCKTHGLMRFTGAVKNQYGCIAGLNKAQFHAKYPRTDDFAAMLADINTFIKPRLFIMDAILAMEGNGPGSGTPKKLNVLLFSADPVALDAVACRIIDFNPAYLPTSIAGKKAGLGTWHADEIELLGDPVDRFINKSFSIPRTPIALTQGSTRSRRVKRILFPRPVITPATCIKCGKCVGACPVSPKAVDWKEGNNKMPPVYDYDRCIRCYCCHEICPEGAIHVKTPVAGKVLAWVLQVAGMVQQIPGYLKK